MTVQVRRYREEDGVLWDAFVQRSCNGNFFHTRRFLRYHPAGRFRDHSLLFLEGDRVVAILSAVDQENGEGRRLLVSHPGASYGGGIVLPAPDGVGMDALLSALEDHAGEEGFSGVHFLRLPPATICRSPLPDLPSILLHRGWVVERSEIDSSILLTGVREDSVLDHLDGKCRNMVRGSERAGLRVRESDDFASYWAILTETLRARHGAMPTHTLEEIERLRSLCPGEVRLFAAFHGGEMRGGVVAVTLSEYAIYTLYMAQDYAYHLQHPLHLTIVEVMRACVREGRAVLHVGVSTEDGGERLNEGLFAFKESFGASTVHRESWFLSLR